MALFVTTRWAASVGFWHRPPDRLLAGLMVERASSRGLGPLPEKRLRKATRPARHRQRPQRPRPAAARGRSAEYRLAGQVLVIVAVLGLSFLIELTFLGNLRHDRDQARLAAEFRSELANAIAPVGPLNDANKPLATGAPVAVLEIPRLKLREVIVEGTSSSTLMSGPGHRRDTPLPGQVGASVIAGRRATYGQPFRSIDQLHAGDQITVITGQGKHSFKVLDVRRAGDPLPATLSRGQGRLTLVTTDGPGLHPTDVVRVDAALTSAAQSRPAQLPTTTLRAPEALMAGDSTALLGVFEWSVVMAAAGMATVWFRFRAGPWPAWAFGVPMLVVLGLNLSDEIAALLPNLL